MVLDDFALASQGQAGPAVSVEKPKDPKKREWLRVYETAPAQLLNVYGPSKFANSVHASGPSQHEVSLEEFQAAVKLRHSLGDNGIDVEAVSDGRGANDFGTS